MFTVALIGVDGAGKTTISEKLRESFPLPMKYMYMGINIESSNVASPVSRLIYILKKQKRKMSNSGNGRPHINSLYHEVKPATARSGRLRAVVRLLNRITDETYRQLVSWIYQLRGYIVLYDRHYLFDFALLDLRAQQWDIRLSDRAHRWFITQILSKPDMVIFLDAPPEVLYERKKEWTIEYLQTRRDAFLHQGKKTKNFVRIDATQPVEKVYADVCRQIFQFSEETNQSRKPRKSKVVKSR